ncbi:hypothetical protein HOD75_01600 [archaeon]|nr:hypothetical protein [archaeon]MBT4241573.1 hypothetical protein [archaeon]MBT4417968.1 hypothetical protein [archaeon]
MGYRDDISETSIVTTGLESGVTYVERFTVELPSALDLDKDAETEELSLFVKISSKNNEIFEESYTISMQKNSESLTLLSVETVDEAVAGNRISVDVVVQNDGSDRLDDVYVIASIPELGIRERVYAGDIESDQDQDYDNIRDTVNKKVYLTIPTNAIPGVYDIEVEASNRDASVTAKESIVISDVQSGVHSSTSVKTIELGSEATFDVILVNPNDRTVVYQLVPSESTGLIVESDTPVVAISADSSRVVKVNVKATDSAEEGTHLIGVNVVNADTGEIVKQVSFNVNVEGKSSSTSTETDFVLILTVVLVIIFVVLLIVLIVLLTKRPEEPEEFGETSYY